MKQLILLLFLFSSSSLIAQWPQMGGFGKGKSIKGKITGTIIDTITQEPVAYATLVLKTAGKTREKDGILSEENGKFKFDSKTGEYDIYISFLGYEDKVLKNVELTLKDPDNNLGAVYLKPTNYLLDEVEITEKRALIENKVDKIVYNVEQDATVAGGDATDVLRKVPLLSVDLEGNVSLRGSQNVRILVNGKPSGMFASNVADALKMFPADQIKKVEVITSPSAKYDGEGSAGIINIVTKRENIEGLAASINSSIGNRQNSLFTNVNVGKGRFGLSSSAAVFYSLPADGDNSLDRFDKINQETSYFYSGTNTTSRLGGNGSVSAFYDFNAYNAINSSFTFRGFGFDIDNEVEGFARIEESLIDSFTRTNGGDNLFGGFDLNLDYTRTFEDQDDRELVLAGQLSSGVNNQDYTTTEDHTLDMLDRTDSQIFNDGNNIESTLQIDYVHPLPKSFKLETGAKMVLRDIKSDYFISNALSDPLFSNVFNYNQDVAAGYASLSFVLWKKYSFVTGLRYERTSISGDWDKSSSELVPFDQNYTNWLPNFTISRSLSNFRNLKFSYSRRIQRPSLYYINPFNNNADFFNRTIGNSQLEAELVDQYELSYNANIFGFTVFASSYYKKTTGTIEQLFNPDIQANSFYNVGENNSIGLNFFTTRTIGKFTIRGGGDVFTYNVDGEENGVARSGEDVQYQIFTSGDFAFTGTIKADFFGFFRSPQRTLQGENPSFSIYGMGVRKEFKSASIGISLIEPFNGNKEFNSDLENDDFKQLTKFSIPFRSVGVNFRYKFGKVDFKKRKSKVKNSDVKQGDGQGGQGGQGSGGGGIGG